jgi:5-methylcytosine-specific restriction endonuclease McrA
MKATRSGHWSSIRKEHLKLHPKCAVCDGDRDLNVHHIKAFHTHPELELDPNNLITLCESGERGINCHLLFGHLGDFRNINPEVEKDTLIWNAKLKEKHFA